MNILLLANNDIWCSNPEFCLGLRYEYLWSTIRAYTATHIECGGNYMREIILFIFMTTGSEHISYISLTRLSITLPHR